ncbi:hypothetical protein L195_g008750 [Trifolium pratense]|uniref:Uncharacterized protein n=1 Tax=Trifolium pratense TaxID=57577 RepID=A0A2K3PA31_TRIPR|nr:hypothetical protein L195_g008750 [Trifolium pratense]
MLEEKLLEARYKIFDPPSSFEAYRNNIPMVLEAKGSISPRVRHEPCSYLKSIALHFQSIVHIASWKMLINGETGAH